MSTAFASTLGLEVARLASPLKVESPVGGTVDLDRGCCGCEIEVAERRLLFAFVLLDMWSFDVIVGMDWLSLYQAVVDCFCQRNELSGLLATLLDSEDGRTCVELPRVVCEYPYVFFEDLTSLSPHREIEFTIDLVPRTTPISIMPYRFAPVELHQLKIQLQELLEKGFIRHIPSGGDGTIAVTSYGGGGGAAAAPATTKPKKEEKVEEKEELDDVSFYPLNHIVAGILIFVTSHFAQL
ncbi:uncharacterized protein LOC114257136 [Camellia sinensis]|uniref:uncharacterized protein LOC114257136 n=1 Tax=Camellia sinensis TaxID=4442 RepID=UPI00103562E3|nr:uncharacterized protein LOC114257136 [Camellia sinensis]